MPDGLQCFRRRVARGVLLPLIDATALPFSDHQFNAVLCQQGLQFFPDRLVALHERHRVAG